FRSPAADGDQYAVAADGIAPFDADLHAFAVRFRAGHLAAEAELEALFLEQLLCLARQVRIHPGEDAVEVLQHGDLRSQPPPDGPHLQPDVAGTDHDQLFGDLAEGQRPGAADDAVFVDLDVWQRCGRGAGGNQNALGGQLLGAFGTFDNDPLLAVESAVADVAGDFVLLEQAVDPAGERRDD